MRTENLRIDEDSVLDALAHVSQKEALPSLKDVAREAARRTGYDSESRGVYIKVSDLVKKAFKSSKFSLQVLSKQKGNLHLPLDTELEDRLRTKYGLRDVIVLKTDAVSPPSRTPADDPAKWDAYDDWIHNELAYWAARTLSALLRPHDVIAFGSGRGVGATVERIPKTNSPYNPTLAVALTGRMNASAWNSIKSGEIKWDADMIVEECKVRFPGIRTQLCDCDITAERDPPSTSKVKLCLIGIGAYAGKHRLRNFERVPELHAVKEELARLKRILDRLDPAPAKSPFGHWLGDVCNSLFVVDDIDGQRLAASDRRELQDLVNTLNAKFVNTAPDRLADICSRGTVLAVGGGPHKAAAIRHVLRQGMNGRAWITNLVTDSIAASRIADE